MHGKLSIHNTGLDIVFSVSKREILLNFWVTGILFRFKDFTIYFFGVVTDGLFFHNCNLPLLCFISKFIIDKRSFIEQACRFAVKLNNSGNDKSLEIFSYTDHYIKYQ